MLNTGIVLGYISTVSETVNGWGWYRIAMAKSFEQYPPNSCIISMKRHFNTAGPEYQKIQFLSSYYKCRFVSLFAFCDTHIWTKIRETHDKINDIYYIEIYQATSNRNSWLISVEDALCTLGDSYNWQAITPVLTQETVSDVTILASLDLPGDNTD